MIELHQLRCFVAVAEELHFGRAARRLFMTQPPLSRQIQLLEHALGIALLERSSRQVSLTAAGERFLRDARHILEFSARAEQAAQRVAHGGAGRITLGFTAVSAYRMIPMLLAHAARALPDVDIELREMVSTVQIDALASRMLDAGFVRQRAARQPLEYRLVQREPMLVAVAEGAPLAACERIGPDELDRQPFIAYSPNEGKYFHDLISGLFANAGGCRTTCITSGRRIRSSASCARGSAPRSCRHRRANCMWTAWCSGRWRVPTWRPSCISHGARTTTTRRCRCSTGWSSGS